MSTEESDKEALLQMVAEADKDLFDAGFDVHHRLFHVPIAVMEKLGYLDYELFGPGAPVILGRVRACFESIYRAHDLAVGGHIGIFMYRDIFARIGVPRIYGNVALNPFDFVDLTPNQKNIIQYEPDEFQSYIDQFIDVSDIQYGIQEIKQVFAKNELATRLIGLSRLHLHSASAVLTGGYDYRGAVQAALLATELGLKAGAAAQGCSELQLKEKFGHRCNDIADSVGSLWPTFDLERVKRVIKTQPHFVLNRYSATQPGRREVGHLVMGAQYVVSEIVRQISDRNFRESLSPPSERAYPA